MNVGLCVGMSEEWSSCCFCFSIFASLSVCCTVYLSVGRFRSLCVLLHVCLSVCLSLCVFVCLHVCPSVCLSTFSSIFLSSTLIFCVCQSIEALVCVSICVFGCLYVSFKLLSISISSNSSQLAHFSA
jgi:hypothetical protein